MAIVLLGAFGNVQAFSLVPQKVFGPNHFEIQRLVTSQFIFASAPQAFWGLLLLYQFRAFERMLGSRKFGAFIACAFIVNVVAQVGLSLLYSGSAFRYLPAPGAYFILLSCLPLYYVYVPRLHTYPHLYKLFGFLVFSEKSLTYFVMLQLALSNSTSVSRYGTVSGDMFDSSLSVLFNSVPALAFGLLYCNNVVGLQQRVRFPSALENIFVRVHRWAATIYETSGRPVAAGGGDTNPATMRSGTQQLLGRQQQQADMAEQVRHSAAAAMAEDEQIRRAMRESMSDYNESVRASGTDDSNSSSGSAPTPSAVAAPLDEDNIATLLGLGIPGLQREEVIAVLRGAGNDVGAAADILLSR